MTGTRLTERIENFNNAFLLLKNQTKNMLQTKLTIFINSL